MTAEALSGSVSGPSAVSPSGVDEAGEVDPRRLRWLEHCVEGLSAAVETRDVIGQAKGILMSHYALAADDAFGLLVRLSQNTNTKLSELAAVFVERVRERGPADPARCLVVTGVVDELLAEAGHGRGSSG